MTLNKTTTLGAAGAAATIVLAILGVKKLRSRKAVKAAAHVSSNPEA